MKTISLFLILMMLLSPITIANESLEFFERTEEGYLLPYENEDKLVSFINDLQDKINKLQDALKEERKLHDKQINIKDNKIDNLEKQIEVLINTKEELEKIVNNDKEIINLTNEQLSMMKEIINKFNSIEKINKEIENSYKKQLETKDKLIKLEKDKRFNDIIKYSVYSFVIGGLIGIIIK